MPKEDLKVEASTLPKIQLSTPNFEYYDNIFKIHTLFCGTNEKKIYFQNNNFFLQILRKKKLSVLFFFF